MLKKNLFLEILLISSAFLALSCSVKYDEAINAEDKVPEFVFNETKMIRYENNSPSFEISAGSLEQYKNTSETYGRNVKFTSYSDGEQENTGSCDYLAANTDRKIYKLFGNIEFNNQSDETTFYASKLMWNEQTEQLTGGKRDTVTIQKGDTRISGEGFSADGVTKTFDFSGFVTGEINQE